MARPIFAPFALQGMQLAEQQQQNAFGRNDTDRLRELQRQQFEEQQRAAKAREANSSRYSDLLSAQNALARDRFEAGVDQNSFENTINVGSLISNGVARPATAPGVLQGILEGAPGANDPMVEAGGLLAQFNPPEARMQQAEEAQRRKNAMDSEAVQGMLSTFGTSPPPGMNISMPGPGGSRISFSGQRPPEPPSDTRGAQADDAGLAVAEYLADFDTKARTDLSDTEVLKQARTRFPGTSREAKARQNAFVQQVYDARKEAMKALDGGGASEDVEAAGIIIESIKSGKPVDPSDLEYLRSISAANPAVAEMIRTTPAVQRALGDTAEAAGEPSLLERLFGR